MRIHFETISCTFLNGPIPASFLLLFPSLSHTIKILIENSVQWLGFEPGDFIWYLETDPLSYGGRFVSLKSFQLEQGGSTL